MIKVYATVGDIVNSRVNKKGEREFFTIEGERVISNMDIGSCFQVVEQSIRTLWPTAVIRFERDQA